MYREVKVSPRGKQKSGIFPAKKNLTSSRSTQQLSMLSSYLAVAFREVGGGVEKKQVVRQIYIIFLSVVA